MLYSIQIHCNQTFVQTRVADADLREYGAGPGGAGDLVVLLRARALVLCRAQAGLPRPAATQPQLAQKGRRFVPLYFYCDEVADLQGCGVMITRTVVDFDSARYNHLITNNF